MKNDLEKATNLKWMLVCFEQLSGMKINYDKSDLLAVGLEDEIAHEFAKFFFFAAKEVTFQLNIWVFLYILLNLGEKICNQ